MNWLSILFAAILSFAVFFGSLIVLHFLWLKPHKVGIPQDSEDGSYSPRKDIGPNQRGVIWAESLRQALNAYLPLIKKLDSRYWVSNIGLDGYCYLLFQRQILRMLFVFCLVYALFNVPLTLWYRKLALPESPDAFDMETHDARMKFHQELRTIVDCLLVCFYSLATFWTLYEIKRHIAYIISEQKNSRAEREDTARMKERSVHVTGVYPEDRRGELLLEEINGVLDASNGGRVVSMIIVHDFVRVVELENERKHLESAYKVYGAEESVMRRLCFPWKFRQGRAYERKLQAIDDQIEKEIMKPLLCAGHAFICFDSVQSRNICLECYRPDAKQTISALWASVAHKDPVTPARRPTLRRKVTSTFQKFDDDNMVERLRQNGLNISMKPLESPIDIFWANMGGGRGLFFLRRFIIFAVSIFVLLFLSTPASLLTAIKQIQFLDVTHYISDDNGIGTFIKQNLPTVLILSLNQLLLLLIDYAAYMEKHDTHTGCQVSIFYKALFYLTLNMLIIPSLTLATADSLFTVLIREGKSVAEILKQFYFSSPGSFFVNILLQNGAFSSSFHLLRLSEFFQAYGYTFLAYHQRNIINDYEKWRKQEMDVFQYGYFYGQIVSAFAIIIAYSVSNPWVMMAGLCFFLMRYSVDGFNLLTVFKMETESEGKMIQPVLTYTGIAVLFLQGALAISFFATGYNISFGMIILLFFVSVFIIWRISKPIVTTQAEQQLQTGPTLRLNLLDVEGNSRVEQEDIKRWEAAYKHPLLVSPAEFGTKSRSVSAVSLGSNNPPVIQTESKIDASQQEQQ